jgi:hypothetical protein
MAYFEEKGWNSGVETTKGYEGTDENLIEPEFTKREFH